MELAAHGFTSKELATLHSSPLYELDGNPNPLASIYQGPRILSTVPLGGPASPGLDQPGCCCLTSDRMAASLLGVPSSLAYLASAHSIYAWLPAGNRVRPMHRAPEP